MRVGRGLPLHTALVGTVALALVACTSSSGSETPSPTHSPAEVATAGPRLNAVLTRNDFHVPPEEMPYPYTTPTPPPESTRLDGTYLRILTLDDVDGVLPFRCVRCPPYYPHAGVATLILHRGNYWVNHQLSGFKGLGMFTVEGRRITFFNDPWCPQDRGVYRWTYERGELTFELLGGGCVYEHARARDLSIHPWTRIKPCVFRIEHLWPGPVAC